MKREGDFPHLIILFFCDECGFVMINH
jgi:hypothetical protein